MKEKDDSRREMDDDNAETTEATEEEPTQERAEASEGKEVEKPSDKDADVPLEDQKLRILVVDDTILYRRILSDVASAHPHAQVIGVAVDGRAALRKIALDEPDLMLLDVEMPNMDGLETLRYVKEHYPDISVVMVSGVTRRAADITMEALEEGALDFVPKPKTSSPDESREELTRPLHSLIRLTRTKKFLRSARRAARGGRPSFLPPSDAPYEVAPEKPAIRRSYPARSVVREEPVKAPIRKERLRREETKKAEVKKEESRPVRDRLIRETRRRRERESVEMERPYRPLRAKRKKIPRKFSSVVIGVSTGGPFALSRVIPKLSAHIPVPIFIVQHMPDGFTESLARQLNRKCEMTVKEAEDGETARPGTIYIAQGGRHMVVREVEDNLCLGINDNPPVRSCRPSIDVLMRSFYAVKNSTTLSIIMTGMGEDGADGVQGLERYDNYTLVQDEQSCVVFGMPRAILDRRLANEVIKLDDMPRRINELLLRGVEL